MIGVTADVAVRGGRSGQAGLYGQAVERVAVDEARDVERQRRKSDAVDRGLVVSRDPQGGRSDIKVDRGRSGLVIGGPRHGDRQRLVPLPAASREPSTGRR